MSETELLQAFRNERSEEAFAELVRRYAGLVYSVAKRRLANAALAEDITQLVFIRFAKTPPRVQSHAALVGWLHRTTINVAIDTWRSETRRRTREQQAVVMEPATNTAWEDISPNLDGALNQLHEEDRQALLLRFFGRKTMRDVGAALGVSEDAAKMRVSRAVDRLRTQLGVGAACTAAVLGTLLGEHSVEAAPSQLISRLAAMRLPAVVGVAGMGGLLDVLLRISRLKLAAGAVVLALIGIGGVHLLRSWSAPVPEMVSKSPTDATGKGAGKASWEWVDSTGFNASVAPPTKAVKIWFHVLDAETGGGLAHTKVHFAFFGAGGEGEGHDIETDNNGNAPITEPDDPTKNSGPNVFVTAEGHVPKVVGFDGAVPVDYTLRLEPAKTAGGVVVDEKGLPVAGVKILVQGPGNKPGQMENVDFQTCPVTNREDGSWSYSYIPKDYTNEIRFIVKKPGYAVTFPVVPAAQVDLTNLVLVIGRGFTISGQVTDAQGQPVGNADVKILNGNPHKRQSARTDEHGDFTLAGVAGDTALGATFHQPLLATNAAGGVIIRGSGTMISALSADRPTPPMTADTLRRLESLRIESQAELVRQQTLLERLKKLPREELAQTIPSTGVQDPLLSSLLEQLALQEQELASLDERSGSQLSEVQKASAIVADLKEKIDARAQGVLLGLKAKAASLEQGLEQMQEEVEKASIRGPAKGPLQVELAVQAKGFASQTAKVELLNPTNVANFTLPQGNIFRGRVVDEAGNPIPSAVVRTDYDFKNQSERRCEWTAHTDVNGRFEWDSAPAEEICYWFEADGYKRIRGLSLPADGSDQEIVLKSSAAK